MLGRNRKAHIRTGVVMDPIAGIKTYKDSTFAMLLEAQRRGHEIWYMEPAHLTVSDGVALGHMRPLAVRDNRDRLVHAGRKSRTGNLRVLDFLLMRKDPPFDMDYVYSTYMLDLAEQAGVTVVNRPQALRDANEKCFTTHFPQCCVPALITRSADEIKTFVRDHGLSVVKPLGGMGGDSIFQLRPDRSQPERDSRVDDAAATANSSWCSDTSRKSPPATNASWWSTASRCPGRWPGFRAPAIFAAISPRAEPVRAWP